MRIHAFLLSSLTLVAVPASGHAHVGPTAPRAVVAVSVADAHSGAPIQDAEVLLIELRRLAKTNWLGEAFIAEVPVGIYRVRVRRLGYAPSEVSLRVTGDTAGIVFMLEPSATPLDSIRVVASHPFSRLAPFEMRRKLGFGRFLTNADLAVEGDRELSSVLSGRIAGLRSGRTPSGSAVLLSTRGSCGSWINEPRPAGGRAATERGSVSSSCLGGPCRVRVLLDEMDVSDDIDFFAKTWDPAGVEYYSAASVPVQYRDGRAGCGVLLLWTKPY